LELGSLARERPWLLAAAPALVIAGGRGRVGRPNRRDRIAAGPSVVD
jgi:hypothetical protein